MDSTEKVLQQIIQLQNTNRYSDQQMADKIGCSLAALSADTNP